MTVVLCGVAADTGNVDPVPTVGPDGRFEYVPIPEKGPTTETRTFGSIPQRHGDGVLADGIDRVRPNSEGDWLDDRQRVRDQPVHHDPNFDALTYGEHRPAYVARLSALEAGDAVAFYAGMPSVDAPEKHRYLIGWFTVDESPIVLEPDAPHDEKAAVFQAHPENAHAKRFGAYGDCYYHDPEFSGRRKPVVVVPGRAPGGLLDRAIRLSDRRRGPNYYMREALVDALGPPQSGDHGVHLGGIKPAIRCPIDATAFEGLLERRS